MMATDIQPNRLEKAKLLVNRLIDKLENDQIGLVLFAGRAYIQMPLTSDHAAAKIYVSSASPDAVPTQGTVIADALEMCNSAFSKKDKKYKVVILISDGEDHDPRAADLSKQLADDGVLINTVGVGTPTGSTIIDPNTKEMKRDDKGNPVISKLNEAELSQITQASKGQYQLLADTDEASDRIVQQIDAMEQKSITDQNAANYRSHFQWFVAIALALLMADILIAERNQSDRKSRKITVA
jgi:Ca-activated chloride channel family protein